jgi:hypothetical protein
MVQQIMPIFLSVIDLALNNLAGNMEYTEFQTRLRDSLNEAGRQISESVLAELERQIKADPTRREGWHVCRAGDEKSMLTSFGTVRYRRTYYVNPKSGERAYLVDRQVGYGLHQRVDSNVKAAVVARAADLSYRKSGERLEGSPAEVAVSGQTVMNALRRFKVPAGIKMKEPLRRVSTLYIEADEDHVAGQNGRNMEARLVYVHEGWQGINRRRLLNTCYISSVGEDTAEFWERVWEEVARSYEMDAINTVYLMGDGAAWIRAGLDVFVGAQFILDQFHIKKALTRMAAGDRARLSRLKQSIHDHDLSAVYVVVNELLELATSQSRIQTIQQTWTYLFNHWDGILAAEEAAARQVGCSGEGHISHILSARLSSRPMGWTKSGARRMAEIRTCRANGRNVGQEYLNQQTTPLPLLCLRQEVLTAERKQLGVLRGQLENIPVLRGPRNFLFDALKSLSFPA